MSCAQVVAALHSLGAGEAADAELRKAERQVAALCRIYMLLALPCLHLKRERKLKLVMKRQSTCQMKLQTYAKPL